MTRHPQAAEENDQYHNIWLCGPAERVFEGSLEIK
jgi:hypothetical protein